MRTKTLDAPVAPGGTIGILGGGQLGRMLALAAARLGFKTHIYSDEDGAPAFQVASARTKGAFDDHAALRSFADACDVVTFEFENVPAAAIETIAGRTPVNPSARAAATTQDRLDEKTFVASLGLKTPAFLAVSSADEARAAFETLGATGVLKTRRLGYDGKGQAKISDAAACARAFEAFGAPAILEEFVTFEYEASIIAARGLDGTFAAYDPPENIHEHHILRRSIVPSRLSTQQCEAASAIARRIGDALGYVGVFAVELFVQGDGTLLVNEIAPRVHNSGHWTIEACRTSQFEQHIRAIAGWPLGSTERHSDAVMENLIGEEAADWQKLAANGGALHLYGKTEIRPGRKMGHVTWLSKKTAK